MSNFMLQVRVGGLLALSLAPFLVLGAEPEGPKPSPIEERFLVLRKEYLAAVKGDEDHDEKRTKLVNSYAPRFFVLGTQSPQDEASADALMWILINAPKSSELPKAAKLMERRYLQSQRLKPRLLPLRSSDASEVEHFLRMVSEKHKDKDTQALACFSLAQMLRDRAGDDNRKLREEAIALLDRCVKKYADCPIGDKGATIGARGRPLLFEMRNLAIGEVVPDIVGEDFEGKKFKLSDYRGKVVLLSFWATWCPHCMKLVPHERDLIKRLEGKPFALIGVNGDPADQKKQVVKRIEDDQIAWRSFVPAGIPERWNIEWWPTIFIIDHNGVIRHRFGVVSDEELNGAIDPLVAAAKQAASKRSASK